MPQQNVHPEVIQEENEDENVDGDAYSDEEFNED
jgi:hypothetical protein